MNVLGRSLAVVSVATMSFAAPVATAGAARSGTRSTTIHVTTTADDVTVNGNCTLREALRAADTQAKVDACPAPNGTATIVVPSGTYKLTLGELTVKSRVNLSGAGTATVIDGAGEGSKASRVLHVLKGGVVVVSNLTASNAWTAFRNDSVLTLSHVIVSGNGYDATQYSGDYPAAGLDNRGSATVTHSTFSKDGGPALATAGVSIIVNAKGKTVGIDSSRLVNGVHDGTAIDNYGQLDISSTQFDAATDDEFPDSSSEDIINRAGAQANVSTTLFTNEVADGGTAAIDNSGVVTADQIQITNNMGGLWNSGTFVLTNATVAGNNYGDLIDNNGGSLQIAMSTITSNTPGFAAQIEVRAGGVVLVNDTIAGNRSDDIYGSTNAAAIDNAGGKVTARNVTITGNQYDGGSAGPPMTGGIYNAAGRTFSIANSIVAGNTNGAPSDSRDCHGTFNSLGYNLVQINAGCTFTGTTTGNVYGKVPKLGALGNNGGFTQTELPQSGSPVIDAGNPAAPGTAPPSLCPLQDQRGLARPRDGNGDGTKRCDIGAVEV